MRPRTGNLLITQEETPMALPSLSIPDTITVLRSRYPAALICTVCALLLATRAESYAKSNLTAEARLAYVCAECRQEATAGARATAARIRNLDLARVARGDTQATLREPISGP